MAKITLQEMLCAGMEAQGARRVDCASGKYIAFQAPGKAERYFLGASGALRYGKNASDSISLTDTKRYHEILNAGKEKLVKPETFSGF